MDVYRITNKPNLTTVRFANPIMIIARWFLLGVPFRIRFYDGNSIGLWRGRLQLRSIPDQTGNARAHVNKQVRPDTVVTK